MNIRYGKWISISLVLAFGLFGAISAQGDGAANLQIEDSELAGMSWDEIVAAAAGSEVNWHMWGGSDGINAYVIEWVGGMLKEQYDINLNQVPITDTAHAVQTVLGEKEAGKDSGGSVDMIWINGENFRTLKQGGLAFCGYLETLPNWQYINAEDPTIAFDFGTPVDGCEVAWGRAQGALIYNSATVPEPPADIDALLAYACENPNSLTYPAPPDFTGSVFVRHVFYNEADKLFADEGGYEVLLGDFDEDLYNQVAEATWATLNGLESCLWRGGETYPATKADLDALFANSEITFSFTYEPSSVGVAITNGSMPPSTRTSALTSGTIGNVHYVAIPYNAANKAAALVAANALISIEAQYEKSKPDVWGVTTVLDTMRLPDEWAENFASLPLHEAVVSREELAMYSLPELQGDWLTRIEKDWQTFVSEQ